MSAGTLAAALPTAIPSPTVAVWHLGPVPVRAYALCIVAGIVVGILVAERRWRAKGGREDFILDVAVWAVPSGVVGARIYHVITSPQAYFGADGDPVRALFIWEGGLGIWGAIAGGALGAWIACRRAGYRLAPLVDAMAPGLLVAQALGRWGNWFNNELYGGPTDLPWALTVHVWDAAAGRAEAGADGTPQVLGTFHPTFLYESLWCLAAAAVIVLVDRRRALRHGQAFLLYVVLYTAGRSWFEALRIDEANHFLDLRVNTWVSGVLFLVALVLLVRSRRAHAGEPEVLERSGARSASVAAPGDPASSDAASPSSAPSVTESAGVSRARPAGDHDDPRDASVP